ncbi:ATP-binding protein [Kibdelosporangium phytohabitans]|uniref:ATP-binding protein n=1 Tax=Kibdelosporangium phytohabitans TaxID=860235 RepID=UPI000A523FA2|nr:ATP-binding protein [Kibdelosporangium phytohabitans]MBE1461970.1 anti-sigma regulatory factor (Ser/Thr protein kinase) [Kibdelosporangium phytohabitans]
MPPASDQDERPQFDTAANSLRPAGRDTAMSFTLTADWVAPSLSRNKLRQWLGAHDWSPAHIDDLVLSISEAVSNSVEHGYGIAVDQASPDHPEVIEVHAEIEPEPGGYRRAVLTIVDHGDWKQPGTGPTNRRQGLRIMRACTETMTIDHSSGGTTVVLRSWPIPVPLSRG